MIRRTTIEIDDHLLERAKRALGQKTMRGTVEEALRRAVAEADGDGAERVGRQTQYLHSLPSRVDLALLGSGEMWR